MASTHIFCRRGKKIKLTKTTVENLPHAEKGKQVEYFDTALEGFGVRASHRERYVLTLHGLHLL